MKKLLASMLVACMAGSAMAIDWTDAQQKRLKDASEMNCTIDFRYGIYNGNDSASLALAMGKEAGWETVLFNQVRNNVLNGAASLGTVLKAPDMERRYNVYVKILTVGEHGELEGLAKLWLDNPEDYSVYRMYTYAGRWNDWDKLLVEHSKTYLKSAIVGDARTYVSWYLDRQKKTKEVKENLAKNITKYKKEKAKPRKKGKNFDQYLELKGGSEDVFDKGGVANVKFDLSASTFNGKDKSEYLSEIPHLEEYSAARFVEGFNDKSKGLFASLDAEDADYTIVVKPTNFNFPNLWADRGRKAIMMSGKVEVFAKGGDIPVCTYDVIDMKGPMSLTAYSLEGGLIGNAASNLGKELAGN